MPFFSHSLSNLSILATILIVLLIVLSVRRRRDEPIASQASVSGSGDDQNHWFLGVFYANPNDPAVFVRKRYGYGRTLNFGHWISWLILATPILIALAARIARVHH